MDVGDGLSASSASWSFSGDVANSFDTHVRRSVPFYEVGHDIILKLSDFFCSANSNLYDVGCSTGRLALELARRHSNKDGLVVFGVDTEPDMITKSKSLQALEYSDTLENTTFECSNILEINTFNASLIVSYYSLQFIHPRFRQEAVDQFYNSLNWGGALLLFEKVRANDARFQDIMNQLYSEYKIEQGYSPMEIFAKAQSLKGVLEPFSSNANLEMLRRAGFADILPVFKYLSFEGLLAIK